MKTLLLCLSIFTVLLVKSQHQVGHYTITFQDPERGNRNIQTEIYYPATTAGNNTPVAAGEFPVIVFGHGFVMAWSAYQNLWDEFVPRGYIMVFPRTEGNAFSTNHQQFGWDLEYLVTQMQAEGLNASSPIFNAVDVNTALMGHSMGGGASFLAADSLCSNGNTNLKTLIGLAPAESTTNGVSSINSALSVTVPSVIMSGSQDGVTPPVDHHIPMYDNLASDCKTFISVTGGAHCYFANTNTACDFGEGTSSSGISISRSEQHEVTFDFLNLWLDFTLKSDCNDFSAFQDSLNTSNRITYNQSCNYQPLSVVSSIVQPLCNGLNGSATLAISGGVAAYTEDWGGASNVTLPAGSHDYTVTDATGCSVMGSVVIVAPSAIVVSETINEPTCHGLLDGSVSVSISGGTPGYTESWGSANPSALGAGNYSYTVTDANNCTYTNAVSLSQPSAITISETISEPLCNGDANGSVELNISGGVGGYLEDWGGVDPMALAAGSYSVTVEDIDGCEASASYTLNEPDVLNVNSTINDPTCFGESNGSVTLTITGGTSGYTEDWGSLDPMALPAGNHVYEVTDAVGCIFTDNVVLNSPSQMVVTSSFTEPICAGGNTGSASLQISGGTPSYTADWGGENPNELTAGTFTYTVMDAENCELTGSVTITEPNPIDVVPTIIEPSCFGGSDGSVTLVISGGTPAYTEDWGAEDPNNIGAGDHTVTVTDGIGCEFSTIVSVDEPDEISVSSQIVSPSCNGLTDGEVALTINGGTPAYVEDWNGMDPLNIGAGNFSVDVTDALGCAVTHDFTVIEPASLTLSFTVQDETLGGDGAITAATGGGTPNYEYSIGGGSLGGNNVFTGLTAGNYSITVQDANGCTLTDAATVGEPNSSGINDSFLKNIKIYPVPMGENLFIEFGESTVVYQSYTISLANVLGGKVIEIKVDASSGIQIIDVAALPVGTYLLTIKGDDVVRTFKLVK